MIATEEFWKVYNKIIRDIEVELKDEFDKNFERQAFFSEKWARRKSPLRPGGSILIDTAELSRGLESRIICDGVVIYSDVPYGKIHNEGGEIKVTAKMKRFFRAKFYEAQGIKKKTRKPRPDKKTLSDGAFFHWTEKMNLTTEAKFWRGLALMKIGKTIKIPKRQFVGPSPEIENAINEIIDNNIENYLNSLKLL